MFQRILVPMDGSTRAEQALPAAARLAHASSGTIVFLRVVNLPNQFVSYVALEPMATQAVIDTQLEEAKNYLDHLARSNDLINVHAETEVMVGQPAVNILSVVDTRSIDLVVMCSHGYTGMTRWVLGSVAEKVAHHCSVPVLLQREAVAPAARGVVLLQHQGLEARLLQGDRGGQAAGAGTDDDDVDIMHVLRL